jgi:signal transduction histidine kinase
VSPRRSSSSGPVGLRREVAILVPASLLVLLALVTFTLLSYRQAVEMLVEERRTEALRTARTAAGELAAGASPAAELSALRRRAPAVTSAVLVSASGREVAASGEELAADPLLPFAAEGDAGDGATATAEALIASAGSGLTAGPGALLPGRVAALVPVRMEGMPHLLRVDLDAAALAGRRRGLGVLTAVVLVAGVGVVVMLILFLRQLLAPYDTLLARAREVGGQAAAEEDEVELLVRTFERGIAALAAGGEAGADGAAAESGSAAAAAASPGDADMAALRETLAVSLESGLLLLDRGGRVVALNPVGAALLEVPVPPPETPLGEALARHPDLADLLRRAVDRGQPIHRHEEVVRGAGGERTLGLTVHPLRRAAAGAAGGEAAAGAIRGFLVLFADLTEARRQAEEARLADSLLRLGELAAGVAHELRNSLATIRGYLTLMERAPDEAPQDYLAEVRREADHLQRVLEDFLSFARPGSTRLEPVSLAAVAERAAADPALAGEAVELSSAPSLPPLLGDPQLIERAVRNLLRNAVEAQREAAGPGRAAVSPPVRVRVAPADEGVELTVTDHGDGVAPELAERLFLPFATGRPGGVGLGLALSHRIATLHGGTLRLEPGEGGGTVARMWFPAGKNVTQGNEAPAAPYPTGHA